MLRISVAHTYPFLVVCTYMYYICCLNVRAYLCDSYLAVSVVHTYLFLWIICTVSVVHSTYFCSPFCAICFMPYSIDITSQDFPNFTHICVLFSRGNDSDGCVTRCYKKMFLCHKNLLFTNE
jgi:hypothetical protein